MTNKSATESKKGNRSTSPIATEREQENKVQEDEVAGVVTTVKEVAQAAAEFVDKMEGIEESSSEGAVTPMEDQGRESTEEKEGKENGESNNTLRMTMEERKAKMERLRKKIVCHFPFFLKSH